ncbi:MAG: flagellar biosynthetic protein FliO [Oscillospiraceae bacterium]|nr:flagellar biosynthetic protein FliO [Oscillospiraceae bacterium]MDY2846646.1 flagellar biosynthetic protein FliO [Oscillospiraceae bacterium]
MSEFFTVIVALAAVIGLIFLTMYITKSLMKKFNFRGSGGKGIRIIDCAGIGQDKFIAAVQAGEKKLLLGVTGSEIRVLCELSDEDIAAMTTEEKSADNTGKTFGDYLAENIREKFGGSKKDGKGT